MYKSILYFEKKEKKYQDCFLVVSLDVSHWRKDRLKISSISFELNNFRLPCLNLCLIRMCSKEIENSMQLQTLYKLTQLYLTARNSIVHISYQFFLIFTIDNKFTISSRKSHWEIERCPCTDISGLVIGSSSSNFFLTGKKLEDLVNLVAMPLPHTFHTDGTHCSEEEPCCEGKFFGHLLLALTNLIPYDPRSRRVHALVHLHQLLILQQTGPSHVSAASRKGSSREGQDVLTFVINVNLRIT